MNNETFARLAAAEKYFTAPEFKGILEMARSRFEYGDINLCNGQLDLLPTAEQLLDRLIEKLKGKSVYKTLKAIREGKATDNKVVAMTGLSSLLTHVLIEMKQGRREYGMLVPIIFEKMANMVYSL